MKNQPKLFGKVVNVARRYWISGVALALIALVLFKGAPAWAAPVNQTVPAPTATQEATSVPKATNTPKSDNNDNDNNDNNQQEPTATSLPAAPTPVPAAPPPGDGPTGVVIVDRLNVRQGPGTNFAIVGKAERGQILRILNRNPAGDWWRVCCTSANNQEGWVSASLVQPNFDVAQTNDLVPLVEAAPAAPTVQATATQLITPTATANITTTAIVTESTVVSAAAVSETPELTETAPTTSLLLLTMQQTPALIWQGSEFSIDFIITNTSSSAVTNLELRDELPQELKFVTATPGTDGKVVPQSDVAGKHVLDVQWAELAPGAVVTATVKLTMSPDLPDGSVIDNLAVAVGDNIESNTAGVSLGLPPASLPDFQ
ncbi:MAG: SH3 domain-containing protein [Chloroflexi bacterium]|nr:SH3 domain-containing protein [Chloroflexota bacterium]